MTSAPDFHGFCVPNEPIQRGSFVFFRPRSLKIPPQLEITVRAVEVHVILSGEVADICPTDMGLEFLVTMKMQAYAVK